MSSTSPNGPVREGLLVIRYGKGGSIIYMHLPSSWNHWGRIAQNEGEEEAAERLRMVARVIRDCGSVNVRPDGLLKHKRSFTVLWNRAVWSTQTALATADPSLRKD